MDIALTGAACSTGYGSPTLPAAACKTAAAAAAAALKTVQHGVQFVFQDGFLTILLWILSLDQYAATFAKSGDHPFQPRQLLEGGQHCVTQVSFAGP